MVVVPQVVNVINAAELYILKRLEWYILCDVYFPTICLLAYLGGTSAKRGFREEE